MLDRRMHELDSLRGLAAITVLINHYLNVYPIITQANNSNWVVDMFKFSPLHLIWAGHEAVILFFILSGFVLYIPFSNNSSISYFSYLIKRFCRIYLPYLVSIILAMTCGFLLSRGEIGSLSLWFNEVWVVPFAWGEVIPHLLFLGNYKTDAFNPVIWSLVHEMRISILFPLIVLLVIRSRWTTSLIVATLLYLIGVISYAVVFKSIGYKLNILQTISYISMFIAGALLAKYRFIISAFVSTIGKRIKLLLLLLGISSYTYKWWGYYPIGKMHIADDAIISIGASIFIIAAICLKSASKFLLLKPVHFLGKISYSIYLYHAICQFALVHLLYGLMPTWLILVQSAIISVVVSSLLYYWVELPTIRLGKALSKNTPFERKNTAHVNKAL